MAKESRAESFERRCGPYAPMVYRHCLHMLKHPQEAEDAAQESMLRAFRAYENLTGEGVATWLFRIAHNTCLDILKSARMRRQQAMPEGWEETPDYETHGFGSVVIVPYLPGVDRSTFTLCPDCAKDFQTKIKWFLKNFLYFYQFLVFFLLNFHSKHKNHHHFRQYL